MVNFGFRYKLKTCVVRACMRKLMYYWLGNKSSLTITKSGFCRCIKQTTCQAVKKGHRHDLRSEFNSHFLCLKWFICAF